MVIMKEYMRNLEIENIFGNIVERLQKEIEMHQKRDREWEVNVTPKRVAKKT